MFAILVNFCLIFLPPFFPNEYFAALAEERIAAFHDSTNRIYEFASSVPDLLPATTRESVEWALATVYSRAFGYSDGMCIHPLIDLVNTPNTYYPLPSVSSFSLELHINALWKNEKNDSEHFLAIVINFDVGLHLHSLGIHLAWLSLLQ
jgi:hypothetical protein